MDWAWVYATLARNVGWTFRKIGNQPACDIFALLEDFEAHPPSYLIDGWRHLPKPKPKQSKKALEVAAAREEVRTVAVSMFGPASRMPDKVRELLAWANELGSPKKS
jgi:hypothetical protein